MKIIEIHTSEEVEREVKHLRKRLRKLLQDGIIRSHCIEDDLRVAAYNSLTKKKL